MQAGSLNNAIKMLGLVFLLSSPWMMMMMNTMAIIRIYMQSRHDDVDDDDNESKLCNPCQGWGGGWEHKKDPCGRRLSPVLLHKEGFSS